MFTRVSALISLIPYTPLLEESWTLVPRITESRPALCQAPAKILNIQVSYSDLKHHRLGYTSLL